ncbi:MAG: hypothetical protein JWN44_2206 [Myxococcales bacterium]|nr:hypothetical protein [Myxococcales bacterium]
MGRRDPTAGRTRPAAATSSAPAVGFADGMALAIAAMRRFAVTTLIAMFIQVLLALHPASAASAASAPRTLKTVVADGSVWVDVYERGSLKMTVRLCDHNLQGASSLVPNGKRSGVR